MTRDKNNGGMCHEEVYDDDVGPGDDERLW